MKKSNRGIKRILCLLLALVMLSGTALLEPIHAVAETLAERQLSAEASMNQILGEFDEMDAERLALLYALFEELDRIEVRLFELQEQRELYLKQIALLTEWQLELQEKIAEVRYLLGYEPEDQYILDVTYPEHDFELEFPVEGYPETDKSEDPACEYSANETQTEETPAAEETTVEETSSSDEVASLEGSSFFASLSRFFITPVIAFDGLSENGLEYENGLETNSSTQSNNSENNNNNNSNTHFEIDENASLAELETARAEVEYQLDRYLEYLYDIDVLIAKYEALREEILEELDALVEGIMPLSAPILASNWEQLDAAIQAAPTTAPDNLIPRVIQLTANITDAPANTIVVNVGGGRNVQIIGDYEILGTGTNVISVWGNNGIPNGDMPSTLTLGELGEPGPVITGGLRSGVRVGSNGGTFIMYSGTIKNSYSEIGSYGGGVFLASENRARFYMHGGTIEHNTARVLLPTPAGLVPGGSGGGVFVGIDAVFYLYDGYIQDNVSQWRSGGGVMVYARHHTDHTQAHTGARFVMYGGTIQRNITANSYYRIGGGGITVGLTGTRGASFYMHGGLIQYNHSGAQGGGVTIHGHNTGANYFTMTGGRIQYNTARVNGGGVCVWGLFVMTGGTIHGNTAQGDWIPLQSRDIVGVGGGVFVGQDQGRFHMHHGAVISGNYALKGGGIGLSAVNIPPHFYMHGGQIINNTARPVGDPFIGIASHCPYTGDPNNFGPYNLYPSYITTGHGGAIYMRGAPTVLIGQPSCALCGTRTTPPPLIDNNWAAGNGGAIKVRDLRTMYPTWRGWLRLYSGTVSNNEANNGGAIYTALYNLHPQAARDIRVHDAVIFTQNYARVGLLINTPIAELNEPVIRPGVWTIYRHAFTNHDIFVPTQHRITSIKSAIDHPSVVTVGDTLRYRITIINSLEPTMDPITVEDVLPANITFAGNVQIVPTPFLLPNLPTNAQPTWGNTTNAQGRCVFTVTIPAMETDFFLNIYFDVIVGTGAQFPIVNSASVTHNNNTSYSYVETVSPTIAKSAHPLSVHAGDEITYTLIITNPSATSVIPAGLVVGDDLNLSLVEFVPGSVRINGVLTSAYTISSTGELRVTLPEISIPPYENLEVTFKVAARTSAAAYSLYELDEDGEYVLYNGGKVFQFFGVRNVAFIYNPDGDNVESNHMDVEVISTGLSVVKSVSEDEIEAGEDLTYTIIVTNTGNVSLDIFVQDPLTDILAYLDLDGTEMVEVEFSDATPNTQITLAQLKAGYTFNDVSKGVVITLTFTVTVDEDAPGGTELINLVTAYGTPEDGEPTEPVTSTTKTEIEVAEATPLDPTITKAVGTTSAPVGTTVTYILTVTNPNASALTYIRVRDALPEYLTFVEGSVRVNNAVWTDYIFIDGALYVYFDSLTPGVTTITFRATIASRPATGQIVNVAFLQGFDFAGGLVGNWFPIYEDNIDLTVPTTTTGGGGGTPQQPPVVVPDPDVPLAELSPYHYAYIIGYPDGYVRPAHNITRAEVATIFFRLISDEHRINIWSQTNPFADVILQNWFNNAISTLTNANLLYGYPDGYFRPNQAMTRAEFAAVIVRIMGERDAMATATNSFTDVSGHWGERYISVAYMLGWVRGYGDGTFRPNQFITRAEVAALVNRALNRLPENCDDLLEGMVTWPDNMNPDAWYYLYMQEATNSHHHEMKPNGINETWTELITPREWWRLERPNSNPNIFTGADIGAGMGMDY